MAKAKEDVKKKEVKRPASKNEYQGFISKIEETVVEMNEYFNKKIAGMIEGYKQSNRYPLVDVQITFTQQLGRIKPVLERLKKLPAIIPEADEECQKMEDRRKEKLDF